MSDPRTDPVGTIRRAPAGSVRRCPTETVDFVRLEAGDNSGRGQHVWGASIGGQWRVFHPVEVARFPVVHVGAGRVEHRGEDCWCHPSELPVLDEVGVCVGWAAKHHMPLQTEAQQADRAARIFEAVAQAGRSAP